VTVDVVTAQPASEPWITPDESEAVPTTTVRLVQGPIFVICDPSGEISGKGVDGLFVGDCRICSQLTVCVDDSPVEPLSCVERSSFAASFVGRTDDRAFAVFRHLWLGQGLRLDLRLCNLTDQERIAVVRVGLASDLADLFAVKEGRPDSNTVHRSAGPSELLFVSEAYQRGLVVRARDALATDDGSLRWRVAVGPREEWQTCIELVALRGGTELEPSYRCGDRTRLAVPTTREECWSERLPRVETDVPGLQPAFERAGLDLGGLRLFDPSEPDEPVIAAGAPWYMTLFGRDSILTSWMALLVDPGLALGTARILARLQGRGDVPETEEQPGRIIHEVRFSRGASLALADGDLYYGSVDATPLFVMLVGEMWRWGVPLDELRPLLPAVDAALGWVAGPGDPDGDGYVEHAPRSGGRLVNQGWKDSWDSVSFADGRLPEAPLALVEVQAYAYAAWRAGAALAAAAGDRRTAAIRRRRAEQLQAQFDRDFWLPDRGAYAVALDRDKRPVDAVASNMGHCLWAGIVHDPEKVAAVARWLVSPELSTGWGVRTLATSMKRYNPLSYHNGSVWPHDTALGIAGLRSAGRADEALQLATALLAAAQASQARLPELFAGFTRDDITVPVPHPASCSPQAWASASPLLITRALLGLDPDVPGGTLRLDPLLPTGARRLILADLPLGASRITIEVDRGSVAVSGIPGGLTILRDAA
jgi:glycogen debranching enzyme